ncbi:hypothetical protein RB195_002129 [Necator americanus]|uniref:Peptidase family M1 n=1 Tax=Necator americanus TaxID=51031 RepID=A0ABR1DHH7_NECAM
MTNTRFVLNLLLLALKANHLVSAAVQTGLSPHIRPLSYDLTVKIPVLEHFQGFTSSVVIHFNLTATTSNITLHSKNLYAMRNVSLISSLNAFEPQLKSIRFHTDTVEFTFNEQMFAGQYLLTIGEYNGRLSNASTGVIQRNLTLFSTHLQPYFARELLPCVDHPSVKAAFRITVVHRSNTIAESNNIANDVFVVDAEWQKTVFAPTPLLPAYLIAFSVMPDTYKEIIRQTSFGVTVRVHATSQSVALRVLNVAVASFELLGSIMVIPLPLNKVDFILLPDYDGGMENWGHILLSENLATYGDDAHLTYVIAHELAHHWIGNKATEDLTDYISYKVAAAVLDHDSRWERFMLSKYVAIQLTEDFFAPRHSLVMPDNITRNITMRAADEGCDGRGMRQTQRSALLTLRSAINDRRRQSFSLMIACRGGCGYLATAPTPSDHISSHCYLKGVVLLESIETVVGEDFILSAIRNLVATRNSFDLSSFLLYFKDVPVDRNISLAQVYEYWFITGGFPALKVSNTALSFELQQFSAELWPLRLSSKQGLPPFLFAQMLTMPPKDSEVFVNLNFSSFFRVNYDTTTWLTIFGQIGEHPDRFSAVGRAQLVSDFCYFYAHDQVDHGAALKEVVVDMEILASL